MPNCVACGVELEPPVRVSHTIYAKTLYRIAGQDYCRHHIIKAAVAAGIVAEIKPGADRRPSCREERSPSSMTATSTELMYVITRRRPRASPITLGIRTVETGC